MASEKISQMPAISSFATGDLLAIVDVSEFFPSDRNKSVTFGELFRNVLGGTAAAPSIAFTGDQNTGIYSPGADQVSFTTGGSQRLLIDSSGQIEAASLGSASAPAWSFVGDPNTGIYSPGADQLAISTNGVGRLFVDDQGRVGVGGTPVAGSPNIELRGSSTTSGPSLGVTTSNYSDNFTTTSIRQYGTAATSTTAGLSRASLGELVFQNTSAGLVRTNGAAPIVFAVSDSERMRLTSDGRLGLGTSSPSTTAGGLDISSGGIGLIVGADGSVSTRTNSTDKIFRVGSYHYTNSEEPVCIAFGQNLSNDNELNFGGGSAALNAATYIRWFTAANNTTTTGTERMRLDSSGRLGIGTTTPDTKANVVKNALTKSWSADADDVFAVENSGTCNVDFRAGSSASTYLMFSDGDARARGYAAYLHSSDALLFGAAGSERARIDSSGRLLVGTSSTSSFNRLIVQSNPDNSSGPGTLLIAKGDNAPSSGASLGLLRFGGSSHVNSAEIYAFRDGGTWTAGSSLPTGLAFSTCSDGSASPSERMRITQAGIVLIGATGLSGSAPDSAGVSIDQDGAFRTRIAANGNYQYEFNNATGSLVGYIQVNSGSVTYSTTSDYRLKENLQPLAGAAERIKKLPVYRFNFISDPDTQVDGFVAHEVQAVVPEAISGTKDAVHEDGSINPQGIDQSKLVPLLTAALQEAIGRIETLEAEVASLKTS